MSLLERRMQLLLSAEQHARVEEEARATGRSMNAVIRDALEEHFDHGAAAADRARKREAFEWILLSSAQDHGGPEDYEKSKYLLDEELDAKLAQ